MKVVEHSSASYSPRTYVNAGRAQLTVAFALDFNSAGEKLTHKAAGTKYVKFNLFSDYIETARMLYRHCKFHNVKVLNIAGNGIYTIIKKDKGSSQEEVNLYVYKVLELVHKHWPLEMIVSGGQTGVDLAGGIAAELLGIPCEMTLPKGYKQRGEDGGDSDHTEQEILNQVAYWKGVLSREIYDDDIPQ